MRRLLLPVSVLSVLVAMPAMAEHAAPLEGPPGGCEEDPNGCGGGGGPPPQPSLPGPGSAGGSYFVYTDSSHHSAEGYLIGDTTVRFGGGKPHPIGGDGTVRDGFSGSNVTLRATSVDSSEGATVATTASADANFSAESSAGIGYLIEVHAANDAAFGALRPFLRTSGAIASIGGSYSLTASGQSYSVASAITGNNIPLDVSLERSFGSICDFSGYHDSTGAGCGVGLRYDVDLNFVTGSTFTNGNPLSLYGTIYISTETHAGATGTSGYAGQSSAFIDPTVTLNPLFNSPLYTVNVGNAVQPYVPGAVPEPAAWALMLAGFAAVGGASRRQRRVVAA